MAVAPFNWDDVVQWDGPGAIAGSEEILSADRLDRARYAEFLTNYLAAEGKQRNYVLNLNAEWGAGKTWFIKRWYMELKAHYPTVYIDAWQQDFSDDPLLTVISSIIEQLKAEAGSPQLSPYLSTKLASLLKATAPIVTKALFKKVSGINIDEVQEVITADDAGKLVESLFQDTRKKTEAVQLLKHEIKQWVEAIIGKKKKQAPAFILIDELDRCRPSYAVEMLETIKHIFDIPGVVFVLATDTEQLQHAIKVIYGEGFDTQSYLGRFFQRRYILPVVTKRFFVEHCLLGRDLELNENYFWPALDDNDLLVRVITEFCEKYAVSLRRIEQLVDRIISIVAHYKGREKLNIILLIFLCLLSDVEVSTYSKYISGNGVMTIDSVPESMLSYTSAPSDRQYILSEKMFLKCIERISMMSSWRLKHECADAVGKEVDLSSLMFPSYKNCIDGDQSRLVTESLDKYFKRVMDNMDVNELDMHRAMLGKVRTSP
ncbi:KAP family P-loop NTPase fold protein [Aeromonas veronii]